MNKLILLIFYGLTVGTGLWADPTSNAKGVMILTSASGIDPRNVLFSDQTWTGFDGGVVVDTDGQKTDFAKRDIGKIIYFDSTYYGQLDNDQQEKAFRAGIQTREVVVNTSFLNLNATSDLKSLQDSESTLESLVHDYPAIQSLVQPQINLLKDDITKLSTGQNLQDGTWLAQGQAPPQRPPTIGGGPRTLTFTTKDGQKYVNARVDVTDTGISVLTSDGGTTIPFDQLPDDLSGFPESVRKLVDQKHQAAVAEASNPTAPANTPTPLSSDVSPITNTVSTSPAHLTTPESSTPYPGKNDSACARLGETEDEIFKRHSGDKHPVQKYSGWGDENRFSGGLGEWNSLNITRLIFNYSGFDIDAICLNGVCREIIFNDENQEHRLSYQEDRVFLDANSQGHTWRLVGNPSIETDSSDGSKYYSGGAKWLRDDGAEAAVKAWAFEVTGRELIDAEAGAKETENSDDVKGFASAGLGETEDQLVKHYGKVTEINEIPATSVCPALRYMKFTMGNWLINVYLYNGVSAREEIHKINGMDSIKEESLRALFDDFSQGHLWKEIGPEGAGIKWVRDDGSESYVNALDISFESIQLLNAKNAIIKARNTPTMNGF